MKIAIEISSILNEPSGIRTYIEQLLPRLSALDKTNEYLLYVQRWAPVPAPSSWLPELAGENFKPHIRRFPYRVLMELEHRYGIRITERFLLPKIDLYHGTAQVLPPVRNTATVLTRHHFSDMRSHTSDLERFYFGKVFDDSVRRADFIITPSHYTKGFIIDHFKIPPERIRVIYHGIFDPAPAVSEEDKRRLRGKYDLPERFVLLLSRLIPSKRSDLLLRAFKTIADKVPGAGVVLAGRPDPAHRLELEKLAAELGLESRVRFTGEIAHTEVAQFYAAAEAFAFPSISEGFGIPLIEAMAMGCPVIGADACSIPEVVADAGLLHKIDDAEDLAGKILGVLTDASLRASLVEKGLKRAALFSWEKSAREHLAVYKEAA